MLELEMQKLTAAITALIEELRSAKVGNELPTEKETSTNPDKPRQKKPKVTQEEVAALVEAAKPVENTECADQPLKDKVEEVVSAITADDLKTVAMEIARADSSTRPLILSILSLHGAKTITQLDPKHYQEVHAELMSIAYDIAKNGEVTQ
jgi:hypothetical protein